MALFSFIFIFVFQFHWFNCILLENGMVDFLSPVNGLNTWFPPLSNGFLSCFGNGLLKLLFEFCWKQLGIEDEFCYFLPKIFPLIIEFSLGVSKGFLTWGVSKGFFTLVWLKVLDLGLANDWNGLNT